MGDFHFIVRHAMTGAVMLAAFILGWWAVEPCAAAVFMAQVEPDQVAPLIVPLIVTVPTIGVGVQGLHILLLACRHKLLSDPARKVAAATLKQVMAQGPAPAVLPSPLDKAPDDAIFVAVYHDTASDCLVEWARRRRSYYYLGINFAVALAGGFVAGLIIGRLSHAEIPAGRCSAIWPLQVPWISDHVRVGIAAVLVALGSLAAWWLAHRMRRDVEAMEHFWVLAHLEEHVTKFAHRVRLGIEIQSKEAAPSKPTTAFMRRN